MAANAPYFMRGQFSNDSNAQFAGAAAADDDEDEDAVDYASFTPHPSALSGLASEPPPLYAQNPGPSLEDNRHLVELLEAATTAAGQAEVAMSVENRDTEVGVGGGQSRAKRKRMGRSSAGEESDTVGAHIQSSVPSGHKRARMDIPTDPQLADADNNPRGSTGSSSEALLNGARAVGVHSAAALFRRSSKEATRKYTRPPMSKLFMSLQLTPENFLLLQAQAKTYMLDPTHPERQSCVGNRGKGDTDMVKLRLFNCVRDFLNEGAGDQFFGEGVEKPDESEAIDAARALGEEKAVSEGKLVWPRDGNKIISLVTPLLRRMVTNERQRMYAIETRKGGGRKKEGSVEAASTQESSRASVEAISGHDMAHLQTAFEAQSHTQHSPSPGPTSVRPVYTDPALTSTPAGAPLHSLDSLPLPTERIFDLHTITIRLSKSGIRLQPESHLPSSPTRPLKDLPFSHLHAAAEALVAKAKSTYPELHSHGTADDDVLRGLAIAATEMHSSLASPSAAPVQTTARTEDWLLRAVTSSGLLDVRDEEQWRGVKDDVGFAPWAAGVLVLLVELS